MLEKKYEIKEHVVVEKVLVEQKLICDICGKEIKHGSGYYDVSTCHGDWGNDSYESHKDFDICSVECLKNKFDKYCSESSVEYNTMEIKVEHKYY